MLQKTVILIQQVNNELRNKNTYKICEYIVFEYKRIEEIYNKGKTNRIFIKNTFCKRFLEAS